MLFQVVTKYLVEKMRYLQKHVLIGKIVERGQIWGPNARVGMTLRLVLILSALVAVRSQDFYVNPLSFDTPACGTNALPCQVRTFLLNFSCISTFRSQLMNIAPCCCADGELHTVQPHKQDHSVSDDSSFKFVLYVARKHGHSCTSISRVPHWPAEYGDWLYVDDRRGASRMDPIT